MQHGISLHGRPPVIGCGTNGLQEIHVTDFAELERQAEQACRRMAQIGCEVAGVWGNFFPVGSASKNKAMDMALNYCEMVSKYADKYGILIALEPTANPDTVFPTYRDGIDFVKRLNKKSIKLNGRSELLYCDQSAV